MNSSSDNSSFLMTCGRTESHPGEHRASSRSHSDVSSTQDVNDGCVYDISLSSSQPICRICHCNGEEEQLIRPCRCNGSVGYAHESCIRKWIVGSASFSCELCKYEFKTKTKRVTNICKVRFPRPSFKGWLHILLFLSFLCITVTSMTWIMWSQFSNSKTAQSERKSKEITYAYVVNGGFLIIAIAGLYIDSFSQCRTYYKRWCLLNQELIIYQYDTSKDVEYCNKSAVLDFSTSENPVNNTSPTFYLKEALEVSTPNTSANKNKDVATRDTSSSENDGFARNMQINEIPKEAESEGTRQRLWLLETPNNSPYGTPASSNIEYNSIQQPIIASIDLRNISVLRETYV